ncbi:P-loop containing nucleoside triphosphate hydrolases superfamily protein [Artemisia annua]|uniref:P-loop containing nucleoside triphosphate hydrolases superfamily protein n=1 Tax=Artemisia annua TaxID=35608 RepID=A0A2U1KK39_ARTAN|nr:P-loop containing nucleoside triphosphate hydrolases superfamily protein [Artemisia annua]
MLVGVPNVGKSALANSLHQIGRVSAAEKGKFKHATIASHPNIYILDTPGILPPEILDAELSSKLALTGAISDSLIDQSDLAQYFLSILNLSDEYKKWAKFSTTYNNIAGTCGCGSELETNGNQIDFVVQAVRLALFEEISAFKGNMEDENDMVQLIETQFTTLRNVLNVTSDSCGYMNNVVSTKLINLYRTGRLGHYTLDSFPRTCEF